MMSMIATQKKGLPMMYNINQMN